MPIVRVIVAIASAVVVWMSVTAAFAEGPYPINPKLPRTEKTYYATELKCPGVNAGVLDFSMRTPAGDLTRIWMEYSGSRPVKVKMVVFPAGKPAQTAIDVRLDVAMDELARDSIRRIRSQTDVMFETVCSADMAVMANYEALLSANRGFLNGAAK